MTTTQRDSQSRVKVKKRQRRRRPCALCIDKVQVLDYKDINRFRRFVSERGKIMPKRNTGICAKHQRTLSNTIKRARTIGLIPYCID